LRAALDLSLDREAINQVLFDGNAVVGNQPQPPSSPYYAPERPVKPRDLARAKELVKASGVANPTLELMVINSGDQTQLGQMLQSMAKEAGIEIKLLTLEFQTLLSRQAKGDYQASLIGWSGRVDPDGNIYTLLGCIPWVFGLTFAGKQAADNWTSWKDSLHYVDYAIVAMIVAGIVYLFVRRRRRPADAPA